MRKFHRWIATLAFVTVTYQVCTGTILALDEFTIDRAAAEGPGARLAPTVPLVRADIERMAQSALHAALAAHPDAPLDALRLRMRITAGKPVVTINLASGAQASYVFEGATGQLNRPRGPGGAPPGLSLNGRLQQIHSGEIFAGKIGRSVILLSGIALVLLAFTGSLTYFDMKRRRGRNGHTEWLWR